MTDSPVFVPEDQRLEEFTVGGLHAFLDELMRDGIDPNALVITPRDPECNGFVSLAGWNGEGWIQPGDRPFDREAIIIPEHDGTEPPAETTGVIVLAGFREFDPEV